MVGNGSVWEKVVILEEIPFDWATRSFDEQGQHA